MVDKADKVVQWYNRSKIVPIFHKQTEVSLRCSPALQPNVQLNPRYSPTDYTGGLDCLQRRLTEVVDRLTAGVKNQKLLFTYVKAAVN